MAAQFTPIPIAVANPWRGHLALDQDAGDLCAVDQEVVRPLEREPPPWSGMAFLRIAIPLQLVVLRVIFSENRFPPRIKSGAGFFGITRQAGGDLGERVMQRERGHE